MHRITIKINDKEYQNDVESRLLLVHYIREKAKLTGTHVGCDTGNCGACTIHFNGQSIKSCLVLAVQANGSEITTIEGMTGKGLHPIQQAFMDNFAFQCGYCTPGMIMSASALIQSNPSPTEKDIKDSLEGNMCMCTGYQQIVTAIQEAAEKMRG